MELVNRFDFFFEKKKRLEPVIMEHAREAEIIGQLQTAKAVRERKQAVEALYAYCFQDLWRHAQQRKDRIRPDDLVYLIHHSLADLIEKITENKFTLKESLKGYAIGMLRYKILNYIRTQDRAEKKEHIALWLASSSSSPSPEELFIRKEIDLERINLVNNTLAELSETCRRFFRLWMNGMNYEEIAEELEYQAGGIKVLAFRCRRDFRNRIRA